MGSLIDDRPHRRFVSPKAEDWTPDRKVFLFTNPAFFCQRDRDMNPKPVLSARVLDEVCQLDAYLLALYTDKDAWMREYFQERPVELFRIDTADPIKAAKVLRVRLVKLGIRFRHPDNPRELTWLNMHTFTVNDLLVCITRDDYVKLDIEPDKEITFQDQVEKRKRDAWP